MRTASQTIQDYTDEINKDLGALGIDFRLEFMGKAHPVDDVYRVQFKQNSKKVKLGALPKSFGNVFIAEDGATFVSKFEKDLTLYSLQEIFDQNSFYRSDRKDILEFFFYGRMKEDDFSAYTGHVYP